MKVFTKLSGIDRVEALRWLVGGCLMAEILSYLPTLEYSFGKNALYVEGKNEVLFPWIEAIARGMGVDVILFLQVCLVGALLALCAYLLKNNVWWSLGVWGGLIVYNLTGFLSYGLHYYILMILSVLGIGQLLGVKHEAWTYIKVLLVLSYVNSSVVKLQDAIWTKGEVLRIYIAHFPYMSVFQSLPSAHLILSWLIILTQLFFPLALFSLRARRVLCVIMIGMHVSIALVLSIYVFSALMVSLNVLLFLDRELLDVRRAANWVRVRYSS